MTTYPQGITVTLDDYSDVAYYPAGEPIAWGWLTAGDPEFVARCIRLANPPDPATRQVWTSGALWKYRDHTGEAMWVSGQDYALQRWHQKNGGKP